MTNIEITRRALLGGLGAATAAPAVAGIIPLENNAPIEEPHDRARRLAEELSDAMNEFDRGRWHAVVYPSNYSGYATSFVNTAVNRRAENRLLNAIAEIKSAMRDLTGCEPVDASRIDGAHTVVAIGVVPAHRSALKWFYDDGSSLRADDLLAAGE